MSHSISILIHSQFRHLNSSLILLVSLMLVGCGGGGGGGDTSGGTSGGTTYTLSVVTSGLNTSGLSVGVSSGAGIETLNIASNGTRNFSIQFPEGSLYAAGIGSQPAGQICTVGGSFSDTNMTSDATVTVSCVDTRSVGGGISGATDNVSLRLNNTNTTSFANGSFVFRDTLAIGDSYAVSVATHPTGQTCLVTNSGGLISSGNITDVQVNCSASVVGYKVGGYVAGFSGVIRLGLNGLEEISTTTNGSFTFSTSLPASSNFDVSVIAPPAGYSCTVKNGTGVINSSDYPFVDVDCESSATGIKPKVDSDGAWLDTGETITLTLNGTTDLTLDKWDFNAVAFSTALNPGDSYVVTIKTLPPARICALSNSVGVIQAGVTPVVTMQCVNDTNPMQSIGGNITNLIGDGLVVNIGGRESLPIAAGNTSYTFAELVPDYTSHNVSIESHPAGQICSLSNSYISAWGSSVSDLNVTCSNGPHQIGGAASGIMATGLSLTLNNNETINVNADGNFNFSTLLSDAMNYSVVITSQPPEQICSINDFSGYNLSASVSNIFVDCVAADYAIKTNVKGYSSTTPLLLQLNGDEIFEVTSNTVSGYYPYPFNPLEFLTRLNTGESYLVTIAGQPEGQLCSITSASGTVVSADVSDIGAVCENVPVTAGPYTVNVTTSGLLGSGLVLQLNGGSDLSVTVDSQQSFTTQLADTAAYTVSVLSQPSTPLQHCNVVNNSGVVAGEDVTHVSVQCGNAVQAHYRNNGGRWLSFVKNDGVSTTTATDTACEVGVDTGGYTACLNGGEYVSFAVPALASCASVTAQDNLDAFNWICDDSAGVRIISNGLKTTIGLSDLVDFTEVVFKDNFVSVYDSAVYVDQTQTAGWWSNTLRVNNTGDYTSAGEINLVTGGYDSIQISSNSAALVEPGAAFSGDINASSGHYLWIEGDVSGSVTTAINLTSTWFSKVQNAQLSSNAWSGLRVSGANNVVRNIVANTNGSDGISVSSDETLVSNLTANNNTSRGLSINANQSQFSQLSAENNGGVGIYISTTDSVIDNLSAINNTFSIGVDLSVNGNVTVNNVLADGNGTTLNFDGYGIRINGSWSSKPSGHSFNNLTARNNGDTGIWLEGFSASVIENVTTENNGGYGIELRSSETTKVRSVTALGNAFSGISFFRWNNTRVENLDSSANSGSGLLFSQSEKLVINQIKTNNNTGTGFVTEGSDNMIIANVLANNNGASGIGFLGSSTTDYGDVLFAGTAANNQNNGFVVTRTDYVNLLSIMSVNNASDGLDLFTWGDFVTVDNMVSSNNGGYGFNINASDIRFSIAQWTVRKRSNTPLL